MRGGGGQVIGGGGLEVEIVKREGGSWGRG